ncbi:Uncharacterized protein dnm_088500 [Desulfonema magnum]|uniref:Uncharacterized protein n=1 Tax=Desulfonema magnum TaxID=45655 RepID=A0A975GT56_9BACT|nr:Uncharacterized protein dnm_088500 [Desulfonema magnum]
MANAFAGMTEKTDTAIPGTVDSCFRRNDKKLVTKLRFR